MGMTEVLNEGLPFKKKEDYRYIVDPFIFSISGWLSINSTNYLVGGLFC